MRLRNGYGRILLCALVLIAFVLASPPEAEAACYQCDSNNDCDAYDTGELYCSSWDHCGPDGCSSACSAHGGACTGGCANHSPEGECLEIENKSGLHVIPNGEVMLALRDFPPRHRFEPSSAKVCDASEPAASPAPTPFELGDVLTLSEIEG